MLVAGNWKMYKGPAETSAFLAELALPDGVEAVVCPPFASLAAAVGHGVPGLRAERPLGGRGRLHGRGLGRMLLELAVEGAIVGHSERRQLFGETDETVRLRCEAALAAGLRVIACVGETDSEREAGETEAVLRRQVAAIPRHDALVIAYEPVWAIGTGKTATPEIAQTAHALIKELHPTRVLYGGSVKPENAAELLAQAGRRRRPRRRRLARPGLLRGDLQRRRGVSTSGEPLVTLVILDGWGLAPPGPGNAVDLAHTPVFDDLARRYASTRLDASGAAVGLPDGQMGNSEVGHLTIGSGRILYQDLVRVNRAVEDGSLLQNEVLLDLFRRTRARAGEVHLLGLVSNGGVHSHIDHLQALLELAEREGMRDRTWVHAFTDGRDVAPESSIADLPTLPADRIATVTGRYYAMDRDERWERTQRALDAIFLRVGVEADDPVSPVRASYARGVTDEFLEPIVLRGRPRLDPDRDAAIVFNFRPDRVRQLTRKLLDAGVDVVTMTRYSDELRVPGRLPRADRDRHAGRGRLEGGPSSAPRGGDGEVRPRHVLPQRRGRGALAGEARILVPSPRDVPSYDLAPGDVRREGCGAGGRGARRRPLALRRQLREPGHGRAHRRRDRRRPRGGERRRLPRGRRGRDAPPRRSLPRHRRPRQRREAPRGRRHEPAHRAHDESRAADRHPRRYPSG